MKYCEECGAVLEDNAEYCGECGAKQSVGQEAKQKPIPPKESIPEEKQAVPKDRKSLILIITAVVILAILAVVVFLVMSNKENNRGGQQTTGKNPAAKEAVVQPTEKAEEEVTEQPTSKPTELPTPEPTEQPTPEPTEPPTPEPPEQPTPEPIPDYASMYSYLIGDYMENGTDLKEDGYIEYYLKIKQIKGNQVLLEIGADTWGFGDITWEQETYGTIQGDKIRFDTIWGDEYRVGYGNIYIPSNADFDRIIFELVTTGENEEFLGPGSACIDTMGYHYLVPVNPYAN